MKFLTGIAQLTLGYAFDTIRFYFWSAMARPKSSVALWLFVILMFNITDWYLTFYAISFAIGYVWYLFSPNTREALNIVISIYKEAYHAT